MQRYEESIEDCGAALELDNSCLAAMVQRGKCYMELQEWDKAVSIIFLPVF
jgi:tetratricopeptide (TPR) repeat protein